jgi:TolA-binding protein
VLRGCALVVYLALFASPISWVPAAVAIEDADQLWRVGANAFNDKLYPTARDAFKQFVEQHPGDGRAGEAWLLLGKAQLALGNPTGALEAFRRAAIFVPPPGSSQEAKFWEAETLFRLKRFPDARAAYDEVIRVDAASPLAPDAMYGRAWSDLELKQIGLAVAGFRQLLEVREWADSPLIPQATFTLARTLVDLRRYDEAVPLLESFSTKYSTHTHAGDAQYLLGWTRIETGKTSEGIADLRTFIAAYPTHELVAAARRRITEAVRKSGDRGELTTEYQALLSETPTSADALATAAEMAGLVGQTADQEIALRRLREEFPTDPRAARAAMELARFAVQREDYGEAVRLATAAAEVPEHQAEALVISGESSLKLGLLPDALGAFEAVATARGADRGIRSRALLGRARIQEEQEKWAVAIKLYDEVAADSPDPALRQQAADSLLTVAKARFEEADYEVALDGFRRARKLSPPPGQSQEARFWEAQTLVLLKRLPEARAAFDAVVRGDADSPHVPDALYGLAWVELEAKRYDPAIRHLRSLVDRWPDHRMAGDATYNLARTLADVRRYDEAIPLLAGFLDKYPSHEHAGDAQYLLGWARLSAGKTAEGITTLRAFIVLNPTHELVPEATRRRTEAVLKLGDPAELAIEYEALMSEPNPTPETLHDAGMIAGQLDRPSERDAAWTRLRDEFPQHPLSQRVALDLAHVALERERYDDAVALAEAATQRSELQAEAHLLIGDAELKRGHHAAAITAFKAAISVPGADKGLRHRALAGIAEAYQEQQAWSDALAAYEGVATEAADDTLRRWAADSILDIAKARLTAEDLELALDGFRRARKLTPPPGQPQEARYWEAETLMRLKRYHEARPAYEAVLRDDARSPVAPEAAFGLGRLEMEVKRYESAIRSFRTLIERWPDHPLAADGAYTLARMLIDIKRHEEAVAVLEAYTTAHPTHEHAADGQYLLGWTRLTLGENAKGIADLRAFVAANPAHPLVDTARKSITEAAMKLGDKNELASEYQALTADGTVTAEGLYTAGNIADQLGRPADKEAAWKRLREAFPDHPLAYRVSMDFAADAHKREQYETAVTLAAHAAKSDEYRADAMLLLAESELKLKRYPAAIQAFEATAALPGIDAAVRYRALAGSAVGYEEQLDLARALKLYEEVGAQSPDPALRGWSKDRATTVMLKQRRVAQRAALDQAVQLFERKRYGEAAAQARAVIGSDDPGIQFEALLLVGNAELNQRRYMAALQAFDSAAGMNGVDRSLRIRAVAGSGQAFEALQKWPDALQRYEQIVNESTDEDLKRWAEERAAAVRSRPKGPVKPPPAQQRRTQVRS